VRIFCFNEAEVPCFDKDKNASAVTTWSLLGVRENVFTGEGGAALQQVPKETAAPATLSRWPDRATEA